MFFNIALACAAAFGSLASASSVGTATLINNCGYTVYVANTPSADGVHETQSATLATGQSYSQAYTQLLNLMGWSLKVAQTPSFPSDATFQFEYTFLNDGTIWFDLSNVNNQLWNLPFDISSSDPTCDSTMRQVAYLFPTDNSAMETNCTQSADVTVNLCKEPSGGSGTWSASSSPATSLAPSSSPAAASSPSPSVVEEPTTSSSPPPPPPSTSAIPAPPEPTETPFSYTSDTEGPYAPSFTAPPGLHDHGLNVADNDDAASSTTSAPPTTFTTSTLAAMLEDDGAIDVVWVTEVVTEHLTLTTTSFPEETGLVQRHAHAHAHAHGHGH